ncbi:uncharacterized protein LOC120615357 [Pteropus medius]|uniref:uncharacterized protein LOC120615357 n=1 Tax=Pteropus vampyrus TaxID=132908 RepID=UPI00196B12A2|nr:uncharacterized protein LOC120615357 [Pteropus giganteus]
MLKSPPAERSLGGGVRRSERLLEGPQRAGRSPAGRLGSGGPLPWSAPPPGPARGSRLGPGGAGPQTRGHLTWLAPVARWLRQPRLFRRRAASPPLPAALPGPATEAADGIPGSVLLNMATIAAPRLRGLLRRARSRGRPRPRAGALRAGATPLSRPPHGLRLRASSISGGRAGAAIRINTGSAAPRVAKGNRRRKRTRGSPNLMHTQEAKESRFSEFHLCHPARLFYFQRASDRDGT